MHNAFRVEDLLPAETVAQTRTIYVKSYRSHRKAIKQYLDFLRQGREDNFFTRKFCEENVFLVHFNSIPAHVRTLKKFMEQLAEKDRFQLFIRLQPARRQIILKTKKAILESFKDNQEPELIPLLQKDSSFSSQLGERFDDQKNASSQQFLLSSPTPSPAKNMKSDDLGTGNLHDVHIASVSNKHLPVKNEDSSLVERDQQVVTITASEKEHQEVLFTKADLNIKDNTWHQQSYLPQPPQCMLYPQMDFFHSCFPCYHYRCPCDYQLFQQQQCCHHYQSQQQQFPQHFGLPKLNRNV